ncbi:ATP dependent helicase, Lhr family [Jatrophihabitans endophyticus]|uniref:ATP dependent helicase, Lhr family n=1 Tax=Jatrophihabitans endophyticus TaxID=1206085 RepID=A0A1M5MKR3_9ACTN|nr:ATP-dependent helicase [Jatrophihabitans endophyticus]SHG77825.1 ATP dependent helicase, Lhr family [Jatrophihabitans endophyticus]
MHRFSPATQAWLDGAFAAPTAAQQGAWDAVAAGDHTLVVAPTGSGKTLAAFLSALDRLAAEPVPDDPKRRCRVLYVSPLKALAVDVERNLRAPLTGIRQAAARLGLPEPDVTVAMRSGDTPADERRLFARRPADILITTPESLFLLLTSAARESLRGVDTVIVDEVHAVCSAKRGAHLAVSLERLDTLLERPAQRIGLSATVRPVDEVATFLAGGRNVAIVQPPSQKSVELQVVVPVEDMSAIGEPNDDLSGAAAGAQRRTSIWPHVEERVLDLVTDHRSTIVFANSRRLAERLTARLNELAGERAGAAPPPGGAPAELMAQAGSGQPAGEVVVARAHHGSVSREQRSVVEEDLKAGRLPAVVATSSLELGIDMGAVDLVVQVESPPSVAAGLQRVGRAGHQVGAVSRGVIFPKFRGDLLECAVVAERMRAGAIESMRYPRNPLDVLAQQIVAMLALDTLTVDDVEELVRRAAPFAGLPRSALEGVLDMLAGRYPSDAFAELRPRIVWDRVTGELSARRGAQHLAVTSGGTIPDRGLFGVFLASGEGPGRRVGELDEEMVYESRVGDVFLLGSSSWRIEDITHDRVLVTPAPGEVGKMPFWKGDQPGRPVELGRALGAFLRELASSSTEDATARARAAGLDEWGTANLLAYLAEQREATHHLPDDRTILVERFRDELGDWRLVIHSPFGAPVNAPWALAISARLRERYGLEVSAMHSDDGIVLRLPETDAEPPAGDIALFEPDEIEAMITGEVGGSALFASRFRECAARSLLLPRRDPRRRTPLWQQRQRANQLLQVASEYGDFPVVLEAMRECLQDVFDVPGLVGIMRDLASRTVKLVEVETPAASPFARSLLFGYVGVFLYEGDAPLAERRAQALSLDSALLAELLGATDLRELLDPDAITQVEQEITRLAEDRRARGPDGVHDLLRAVGDLATAEAIARGATAQDLAALEEGRRAIRVRIAGDERWLAIEDSGRVRDALGCVLPVGVPEAFTEPVRDPLGDLVSRYARTHGPFVAQDVAARLGLGVAVVGSALARLAASGRLVQGEFRPGGIATEWCDAEVLRAVRRRSLAALRKEVEPVPPEALARFIPAWQGLGTRSSRGADGVLRAVEQLAGVALPASALETLVLPSRVAGYSPALLDELTLAGDVVWAGAGSLAGSDGWVMLAPAEIAPLVLPPPDDVDDPLARTLRDALAGDEALFFKSLVDRAMAAAESFETDEAVVRAVWELVWSGVLTNDTLAPVRSLLGSRGRTAHSRKAAAPRRGRYGRYSGLAPAGGAPSRVRPTPYGMGGRWSALPSREGDATRRALAAADVLLDRYGLVTRGSVAGERVAGGFAAVYPVLKAAEESGRARRGYFVEGLGAAQFALPGAVDRLRAEARPLDTRAAEGVAALVLAATDPANPYGAALPFPQAPAGEDGKRGHQAARKAGALVVLVDGSCVLYVERGGRTLLSFSEDPAVLQPAADALALAVRDGALGRLQVERADGAPVTASALGDALTSAGFRPTPRGLRLRS